MKANVKFMYLRDPEDPNHVITVARELTEDDQVRFAWAINHGRWFGKRDNNDLDTRLREIMSRKEFLELRARWRSRYPIDQFDKKVGRRIATNRLRVPGIAITIPYRKGDVCMDILRAISDHAVVRKIPDPVRFIAKELLKEWELLRKRMGDHKALLGGAQSRTD